MKILVALKRVISPENTESIGLSNAGDRIVATGLSSTTNPFDECALEAALRLTEDARNSRQRLGEVIAVTFGTVESEVNLRAALALGGMSAIRIDVADQDLDGRLVALGLAALAREYQPDLVVLGKQTVDGEGNQVGQMLGELLQWPAASCVTSLLEEPSGLLVTREVDDGAIVLRLTLPAVVAVDLPVLSADGTRSIHTPASHRYGDSLRFATLPGLAAAKRKPLTVRALSELVDAPQPTTRYLRFVMAPARAPGRRVASISELVHVLTAETKQLK